MKYNRLKRQVFLFIILVLGLIGVPETNFAETEATGDQVDVRVMSYNIHAGAGSDGVYDTERIAQVIEESGAEIIALQEVDVHWGARSHYDDILADLAERLDMQSFFAPIYDMDPYVEGDPRRQFGVAILSKYPIVKATNHDITRLSTQNSTPEPALAPGFAEAIINVKGALVPFYSTHLDYRGDPTVRIMQVADMLNIFDNQAGEKVLLGDMNATPEAPELEPLFDRFTDAWSSVSVEPGYTYSALSPNKRIDYIFVSESIEVQDAEVIDTLASDHLPVVADLSLNRGENGHIIEGND
ncbi:metal-dependent hydrolase [Thalassobacillus devorans]|uniref:Metal-dependent hydrolase n=1 Tax=Thalassobacillus devorans TaxID=279813 RepID=A0ABQ1NS51_9BACI|nr:endonuclease/exonuclease/phosphatase family protein [Thalassobacillus devorans]NIK28778.1 endonuclease/exonuclease/phosphatase family metal-dependent hydrolase [Thalassobacillus devorans]GGC83606.1 metal-dependent hydrolase [Thalassobacillus devorans]